MDYREMLDSHIESGADVSIAGLPVHSKDASGLGIMKIDETGRVTGATPIGSHHRGFLQSTIDHIKARWRFRPKLVDGNPVASRRTFLFEFRIEICGDTFCQKVTGVAD